MRTQNNEELEEALSSDVPTLQELIKTGTQKRLERGNEIEVNLQEEVTQVNSRVTSERTERIKTEENIFQLLKSMVNDAK